MLLIDIYCAGPNIKLVDPIFVGVGKVLTPSGRGIRRDALVLPEVTEDALVAINALLDEVWSALEQELNLSLL